VADSFSISEDFIEAEVYKDTVINGTPAFLVKIKFLDIQTYISGIRVQESPNRPEDGLWVQMPAVKVGYRYSKIIECANGSPFFKLIEKHARIAVEEYIGGKSEPYPTIKDEPIDLDRIPF
jgi:hypothetical protein